MASETDSNASSSDHESYEDRDDLSKQRLRLGCLEITLHTGRHRMAFENFSKIDGMVETYSLGRRNIHIAVTDQDGVYTAQAQHPDTRVLLGFIQYREKEGTLELSNFKASLTRSSLTLGITSKRTRQDQAGTHGEGFKLAALIMVRVGYQVRYEASSFYWRFALKNDDLYCNLSPCTQQKKQKRMEAYNKRKTHGKGLHGNIWEDVTVKVGRVYAGYRGQWGARISRTDFNHWLTVALDLNCTTRTIETAAGSLLLDEKFANKVFLKGLLLQEHSGGKPYRYGYNLFDGFVNRDRQRLRTVQESDTLAKIWAEVIALDHSRLIVPYINMLTDQDKWADVNAAKDNMTKATVTLLWSYLERRASELKQFYHDSKNGNVDIELIRKSFKRDPVQLPDCIWIPLRKYELVQTPQERRYTKLSRATIAPKTTTRYSSMVKRALKAALCLDERTKYLNLVFKDQTATDLELLVHGSSVMINEKCLSFRSSHTKAHCWLSNIPAAALNADVFFCDHIITSLHDLLLMQTSRDPGIQENASIEEANSRLRLTVNESLRQMPRDVTIHQGCNPGEVEVSWLDTEAIATTRLYDLNVAYRVTLHRVRTCSEKVDELVVSDDSLNMGNPPAINSSCDWHPSTCGCPEKLGPQIESRTVFKNLQCEEEYFPMIARAQSKAFFSFPPPAISPRAGESMTSNHVAVAEALFAARATSTVSLNRYLENSLLHIDSPDIYDASDSEEGDSIIESGVIQAGTSIKRNSTRRSRHSSPTSPVDAIEGNSDALTNSNQHEDVETQEQPRVDWFQIQANLLKNAQTEITNLRTENLALVHRVDELLETSHVARQSTVALERRFEEQLTRVQTLELVLETTRSENAELIEQLEQVKEDLSQSLQIAANLGSRSSGIRLSIARGIVKRENDTDPTPESIPSAKRVKRSSSQALGDTEDMAISID